MARGDTTLSVKFTGNPDDLLRVVDKIKKDMGDLSGNVDANFAKISSSAEKHTGKIKGVFSDLSSHLKNTIGLSLGNIVGIAGVGGLAVGLNDIVGAASKAQASTASFDAQLKALHITNKATVDSLQSMLEKQSLMYGNSVPSLQMAYSQLMRATDSTTASTKYLTLAQNIAVAKHVDVAQAANIVSRAYVSGGTSLRRYGIDVESVLEPGTKKVDKHATALLALSRASQIFGGQADAYSKTWAGSQQRFSAAMDLLEVKVGTKLLPVLTKLMTWMVNAVDWVTVNWPKIEAAMAPVWSWLVSTYNTDLKPVFTDLINTGIAIVEYTRDNWNTIKGIMGPILVFLEGTIQAFMTQLKGLLDFIKGTLTGNWSEAWTGIKEIFKAQFDEMGNVLSLAASEFGQLAGHIGDMIEQGIVNSLSGLGGKLANILLGAVRSIPGIGGAVANFLTGGSSAAARAFSAQVNSANSGSSGPITKASGGYVPGPLGAGDVVPAMLTPGEVVLNARQQALLGPSRIAQVLASTGAVVGGNRFASGGVAGLSSSQREGAAAIIQVYRQYGLDPASGIAVALNESNLDPTAVGDNGTSFGLFQLHIGGALPHGWTKYDAFDPVKNAGVAARAVVAAGGRKLTGHALQDLQTSAFERPANPAGDDSISNYNRAVAIVGSGSATSSHGTSEAHRVATAHAQTPAQQAAALVASIRTSVVHAGRNRTPSQVAQAEMASFQKHLNAAQKTYNAAKDRITRLERQRAVAVARLRSAKKPAQRQAAQVALANIDASLRAAYSQAEGAEYEIKDLQSEMSLGISGLEAQNLGALAGTASDPNIEGFEVQKTEAQVSGNAAGETAAEQGELNYLTGLYDRAVKTHNTSQILSLGQQIIALIAALKQNTSAVSIAASAYTQGSTSVSFQGQDYVTGGSSSGNLTNLAVGV